LSGELFLDSEYFLDIMIIFWRRKLVLLWGHDTIPAKAEEIPFTGGLLK
jgi:hypothetical protein